MPLPTAFINRMETLLKDEADAFFATYNQKKALGLRVNPLKTTIEELRSQTDFHLQPIPFCNTGFYYKAEDEPGKHPFHQAGLYYIQEPSAMFVAKVLDADPGERILDLCAAPGGKSTQIAAMMNNTGLLVSNEVFPKRAKALSENIERCGVTNTLVTNETPEKLARYFPGYFDKILVDAPCSGEGMFRKDPDAAQYWSPEHVRECAALQSGILDAAYQMLKSGGTLVYSTCTFSPEEDEKMVEGFLERYPDVEIMPIEKPDGVAGGKTEWTHHHTPAIQAAARLWPHLLQGEGHFVAKLKKAGMSSAWTGKTARPEKESNLKDYRHFEQETLCTPIHRSFFIAKNQLFALPDLCPDFNRLRVVRAGLHLGEFKKNRFEPNHALSLALPADHFKQLFPLTINGTDWDTYLRGETLPAKAGNGWTVVTIGGHPLGWGKIAGGVLKNFYPKGLRRRGLKK